MNYRKVYCNSEHCPVSDNCFRHISSLVVEHHKKLILEEFDRDDECRSYDPIVEDEE